MGRRWILFSLAAFMILATGSACTTRYVHVKDAMGNPATVEVKFGLFSKKFISATVQGIPVPVGEKGDISFDDEHPLIIKDLKINTLGMAPYLEVDTTPAGQMEPKILRCSYCAFNGKKWLSYPPGCGPCPP